MGRGERPLAAVLAFTALGRGGRLGGRQVAAPTGDQLHARAFATRRDADGLLFLATLLLAAGPRLVGALAAHLLSEHTGVGDPTREQLQRADGVVVAGDGVVDDVGIAVGVDDGDDRDLQLARLGDGDVLFH